MLGELLAPYYPPIQEREPLSPAFFPAALAAVVFGFFVGPGIIQTYVVSCVLVLLTFQRPRYTIGDITTDYTTSGLLIILLVIFLDHGTAAGDGPRYLGRPGRPLPTGGCIGERDSKTRAEKLRWSLRLLCSPRGIGWNWQVKGVPEHPNADQACFRFAGERVMELVWRSALKALAIYCIDFCKTIQASVANILVKHILDAVVSWCGVVWSFNTIGIAHAAGAAITVILGICEPWEWPPVFGSLDEAWSVRQAWSTTYHQILRRPLQQPGVRLARFLGFKKGTLGSRYLQLYLAFFISFFVHWWQSFTISRHGNGEFAFFMMQPVVITIEDFTQWIWSRIVEPREKEHLHRFELLVGYAWTIIAFTLTLQPIMKGWTDVGLVGGEMS
ncbi:hypothetical protein AAE478_008470 [Parahypoxylon ruwenzoriense]